jgi:peptidoglycan-N-acetylglucosamine deacetylase
VSWCAFSVDLDSVETYSRAYPVLRDPRLADDAYAQCAETLLAFLSTHGLAATMFVVTQDIAHPPREAALRALHRGGQQLGLHSHSHQPALDEQTLAREFDQSVAMLASLSGEPPRGYRAPSYVVHDFVHERMIAHGLAYSSSIMPTPLIVLFKTLFNLKTVGADVPARERWWNWGRLPAMFSPRQPFTPRAGAFWRAGDAPFLEIPLTCVPWCGLPFQFTYLVPFRDGVVGRLAALLAGRPVNTSFHLLDFVDDALSARLGGFNPNLRLPLAERLRKAALLVSLCRNGRKTTTLHEVAIHERRRIHDSRP